MHSLQTYQPNASDNRSRVREYQTSGRILDEEFSEDGIRIFDKSMRNGMKQNSRNYKCTASTLYEMFRGCTTAFGKPACPRQEQSGYMQSK